MEVRKRSLQRSLLLGCIAFVVVLCLLFSIPSLLMFTSSVYKQTDEKLANVVTFVESSVDADDLHTCIENGVPSEKFARLQQELNVMVDDFGLGYLYLVIPGDGTRMISVCSATNREERERGEEDFPLMYAIDDYYTEEQLNPYRDAWNKPGITYFEDTSDWGDCYTASTPLVTSDGETICLICADVFLDDLHRTEQLYFALCTLVTVATSIVFALLLIFWLRRNVTHPIMVLEERTRHFAETRKESKDVDAIAFDASDIHTGNEVESLGNAISQMADDMRHYVKDTLLAEQRAETAEREVEDISQIAYQDALTHVKSKAAYFQREAELNQEIAEGTAEFAMVMVDLNNLKGINDTYGHKNGDKYLVGACQIICQAYKHSPVYRVGGDEFIVLLQGGDYEHREELFEMMEGRFAEAGGNDTGEPWERFSAAVGMADYEQGTDKSVLAVCSRADHMMYEDKKRQKGRS